MIPVLLKIKGLYSYQNEQIIEFSKLTEAHIFGIFGSVGSGKSSILEAITFALYGVTDRLNERGDDRSYNMLNLRSNELLIDFEFKTGTEDNRYRFVASTKRRKRFDDVSTIERKAYHWNGINWEPLESVDAEKIIGLSYENFKRTIIIPQGKFQEFLQLSSTERTRMLKELFFLDKFEFSDKINALLGDAKTKLTDVQARIDMLGTISPDHINQTEVEIAYLQAKSKELETEFKKLSDREHSLAQLKKLIDDIKLQSEKFNRYKIQEDSFKSRSEQLLDYEYCIENYKPLFDKQVEIITSIEKQEKKIADNNLKITDLEQELQKKQIEENNIKLILSDREQQYNQANELLIIADILTKKNEFEKLKESNEKGPKIVEEQELKYKNLRQEIDKLKQKQQEIKSLEPDQTELMKLSEWYNRNEHFQKNLTEIRGKIESKKAQVKQFEQSFIKILDSKNFLEINFDEDKNDFGERLSILFSSNEAQKKLLDQQYLHLKTYQKLGEFSFALHDGESCPLCGSVEHPEKFEAGDNQEQLLVVQKQLIDIDEHLAVLNQIKSEFTQYQSSSKLLNADHLELETELVKIEGILQEHQNSFYWKEFDRNDSKLVQTQLKLTNEIKQQLVDLEENLNKIELNEQEQLTTLNKFKDRLQEVKNKYIEMESAISALSKQLIFLNIDDYYTADPQELKNDSSVIKQKITSAEQELEKLKYALEHIALQLNQVKGNQNAELESLILYQKLKSETAQILRRKLDAENKLSEGTIKEILSKRLDVSTERTLINDYNIQLNTATEVLTTIKKQIGTKVYKTEEHTEVTERLNTVKIRQEELNREIGAKNEQLSKLKQNLTELELLNKTNESLIKRKENLDVLSKLFRSSGFVGYISGVYLQNLCEAANDRFHKLTRQQLSLEIREDNSFAIRDFLNNGQLRHVKTLSGGQTFQAALSLALALADNIQQLTQANENFFFLDEGFGSLDKESLQVVFDTLKSLRQENRIVGVISHVEEMQQEIETYLKIINNPETGSKITRSWDN